MTDRELNIALREMARQQGLCDEWYSEWPDDSSIDECLERYVRGFDFAVEKDYPPLGFIREHFRIGDLHRHRIFLDEDVEVDCESGYYVFLGSCRARLVASGFKAVTVYARHDSVVDVSVSDGARVFVTHYDDSSGECRCDAMSVCREYDRRKKEV